MTGKLEEYPLDQISNTTIQAYLSLLSSTESPPIYHAWTMISAIGATLGRKSWFDLGSIRILPNQYVVLVGAPGVRKSTAVSFGRKLLSNLKINYGPSNTAGRLQGVVTAMTKNDAKHEKDDEAIDDALESVWEQMGLGDEADFEEDAPHILERHSLYIMETELAAFLGMKSVDLITFLGKMWDGDSYTYQLKGSESVMPFPCINLLGALTQQHFVTSMPPEGIGHGFMSRLIMVFAESGKKIAWPEPIDEANLHKFRKIFQIVSDTFEGAFEYSDEAKAKIIELHERGYGKIEDARFLHYLDRRQAHTLKTAMAMAALRTSHKIELQDIEDADKLLKMTESRMAESLGEYGLSAVALARARVMDILKASLEPLTAIRLSMAVGGDIAQADLRKAIFELDEQEQIIEVKVTNSSGGKSSAYTVRKDLIRRPIEAIENTAMPEAFDELADQADAEVSEITENKAAAKSNKKLNLRTRTTGVSPMDKINAFKEKYR